MPTNSRDEAKAIGKQSFALWAVQLSESLPRKTIMQYEFKAVQHINWHEAKARRSLVKHLGRDKRVVIAQDSRVNLAALGKGRSPSRTLNALLRSEALYLLAKNLHCLECTFRRGLYEPTLLAEVLECPKLAFLFLHGFGFFLSRGKPGATTQLDELQGLGKGLTIVGLCWWAGFCWPCLGVSPRTPAPRHSSQLERSDTPDSRTVAGEARPVHPSWVQRGVSGSQSHRRFVGVARRIYDYYVSSRPESTSCSRNSERNSTTGSCASSPCSCCYGVGVELAAFAGLMVLGFFGLLRPLALIGLRRQDIALPSDQLELGVLYIRVRLPKTRHRAANAQHVRIDENGVADWVDLLLHSTPSLRRPWNGSWAALKHRFILLQREVIRKEMLLTSSLRPGGATYLFVNGARTCPECSGGDAGVPSKCLR